MAKKIRHMLFPMGGLNKQFAYQKQPPYTFAEGSNVWVRDSEEERTRGGSRAGLTKLFPQKIGSGNPVRMLSKVTVLGSGRACSTSDTFANLDDWTVGADDSGVDLTATGGYLTCAGGNGNAGYVYRDAYATLDVSQVYRIKLNCVMPTNQSNTYRVFLRMDDTTPAFTTDGVRIGLQTNQNGTGYCYIDIYEGGVSQLNRAVALTTGNPGDTEYFEVVVNGDTFSCYWMGELVDSYTTTVTAAGERVGVGLVVGGDEDGQIDSFEMAGYKDEISETDRFDATVASANGELWWESVEGSLAEVSTNLSLNTDRLLMAAERGQKLYIADNGYPLADYDDGTCSGTALDSASVSDWTTLGLDTYNYVVVITSGTGTVVNGTYEIDTVEAGNLTLASSVGTGTCSFKIERGPKVFDPSAGTLALWTATSGKGEVPTGCTAIARYRDRMVLAKNQNWYTSATGDPLDWDYSADVNDYGRAFYGTTAEAGIPGDPIIALITYSDDFVIFGCFSSMFVLRGDPAYGGQLDTISTHTGIIDKKAWCLGPDNTLFFLSDDGLYALDAQASGVPLRLSKDRLPKELVNIDTSLYEVTLEYDLDLQAIMIHLSPYTSGTSTHYWFDLANKGFWPMNIPAAYQPFAVDTYVCPG